MVLVFAGRCHAYEGIDLSEVVHPLRTGIAAGCSTVILTAAVGGIREDLATGSVMAVSDHLNLTGRSPLSGPEFVDMVGAYAPGLRRWRWPPRACPPLAKGVYAQVLGPQFETPAEIRMLRTLGRRRGGHVHGLRDDRRPPCRRRGPRTGRGDQRGRRRIRWGSPTSPAAGAAAAPAVAEIIRHVVVSLP